MTNELLNYELRRATEMIAAWRPHHMLTADVGGIAVEKEPARFEARAKRTEEQNDG